MAFEEFRVIWAGEDSANFTREDISNKGLRLLDLYKLQGTPGCEFTVPDFFIIPTCFWRNYVERRDLQYLLELDSTQQLEEMITALKYGTHLSTLNRAPKIIQEQFLRFAEDFARVLNPAQKKLTGQIIFDKQLELHREKYSPAHKKAFDGSTWENQEAIFAQFLLDHPKYLQDLELLNKLEPKNVIYRSASPLEDGESAFSGVFESMEDNSRRWLHRPSDYCLAAVLSSAYSTYAQFYMEQRNIQNRSREMSVIVQHLIKEINRGQPTFFGEIQVTPEISTIKYSPFLKGITTFKVLLDDGSITRYDNEHAVRKEMRSKIPFGSGSEKSDYVVDVPIESISREELQNIDAIAQRTTSKLQMPYCAIEFAITSDGKLHFVQAKPLHKELSEKHHHTTRITPNVPLEKIITDNLFAQTSGYAQGPICNLMKYDLETCNDWDANHFGPFNAESLHEFDKMHPGTIYFVGAGQFGYSCPFGSKENNLTNKVLATRIAEKSTIFNILTPNKRGVITYVDDSTWCHLDFIYEEARVFTCELPFKATDDPICSVPDGTVINLVGNGQKAIAYYP